MNKTDEISIGDVVTIKRGTRYPPKQDDSIGIVIDELPTTGDWPVFVVMWDGQTDSLPERRLEKLDKKQHHSTIFGSYTLKNGFTIRRIQNQLACIILLPSFVQIQYLADNPIAAAFQRVYMGGICCPRVIHSEMAFIIKEP